ncbi:hypothetical protein [Gluconobacter sp. OJB]|uniref:hypothetical protein n=1 Tax=Gluconobacter sp. OJB TaxID=3145196 RepID=UPI0031F8A28D
MRAISLSWRWVVLAAALGQTVFPLYWALVTSFRRGPQLFSAALLATPDFDNYRQILSDPTWWRDAANSLISAGAVDLIALILALPGAYALGSGLIL